MRLQIKESTHELTILEKQNPHIGKRLRFIRSLKASPFTNLETTLRNNGANANDARQWLRLYMIGGVGLLMNASIKDPSITGMPLSYSTLSRYVPAERLNRLSVGSLPTQQTEDNSSWGIRDLIMKGSCAIGISSACIGAAPPK